MDCELSLHTAFGVFLRGRLRTQDRASLVRRMGRQWTGWRAEIYIIPSSVGGEAACWVETWEVWWAANLRRSLFQKLGRNPMY